MVSHLLDSERDEHAGDPSDADTEADLGGREDLVIAGVFRRLVHRLDRRSWELLLAPMLAGGEVDVWVLKAVFGARSPHLADDTMVRLLAAGRPMDALLMLDSHTTTVWLARCGAPSVVAPAALVGSGWQDCVDCFVAAATPPPIHPNGPLVTHVSHV